MAMNFDTRYSDVSTGDELRLSDYLAAVLGNWKLVMTVMLAVVALGAAYAFIAPPTYKADALIQVEESNNAGNAQANPNALQAVSQMFDAKSTTAAQIELLRSRLVVDDTVRRLHLDISALPHTMPFVGGVVGSVFNMFNMPIPSGYLSRFAWGNEQIDVPLFDTPKELYEKKFTLVAGENGTYVLNDPDGVSILTGKVGQEAAGVTAFGPVKLKVDKLESPAGVQFELQRFSTLTTIDNLQKRLTVAETALQSGIIGLSLEGGNPKEIAQIVNNIANRYVAQDANKRSAEAENTLSFLDQQLPILKKQLDEAEQKYNTFRNKQGTVDLSEESRLLLQQIVDNKTKLTDLQQQRAELSLRFTANHPSVQALDAQIASLTGAQTRLGKNVSTLPDTEQTALRYLRDVRVNTELYTNLLNSAQQLRIAKAGQIGNVRVVDYAQAPDDPVRPKRVIVILIAAGIGLVLGILIAFVRKSLYGGVERPEEIEKQLGVRVFAIVPRSTQQLRLQRKVGMRREGLHVLAAQAPEDAAVEGIRGLRTSLNLQLADARNNVVMLTGSRPEAGKSFLSVNLATLVASTRKRVLLIDGDMRRGDIHSHFGVRHSPGLSDVLMGADVTSAILHDVLPGVDLITKGSLPSHPSELLASDRLGEVLEHLKQLYDLVIVDTPPVLAVTDATVIGKHAGTSLLVVRHGKNQVQEIGETMKRLHHGGVNMKGVLLTDVPQSKMLMGSTYAGYYGYESIAE
ncbi:MULTISPECIES: polysaccharide biosynthesis tyrosine autokinase [unclassified Caballeronia]|jgi:tyrosine-protein kinase Etk/Wzc|uniref:polysaccharide biosynthesis tyrosine autokinase n=1 Tax=unclassified Caballeronia TaxID=2646786 RepID=UPI001FD159E0|nr:MULTISPECIES: polysaccharide biosynthesis tyrosine autokinase [unclassified Caballeronia]MDR5772346.1 polysaccharide biosynthesis tyrosine autokinase [Caballeronia sp. LZ002]MDR5847780.1 polysaccharide biosynthesis tyrosine autokinase [Caballeronia sp. LZ003]